MTRRKATVLRYGLFWLATFFLLIGPILIVGDTFKLFQGDTSWVNFTITGLLMLIFAMFYFKRHFQKWMESLPFSMGRAVLSFLMTVAPYGILWLIVDFAQRRVELMSRLTGWILLSAVIGGIIFECHLYFREYAIEKARFQKWGNKT